MAATTILNDGSTIKFTIGTAVRSVQKTTITSIDIVAGKVEVNYDAVKITLVHGDITDPVVASAEALRDFLEGLLDTTSPVGFATEGTLGDVKTAVEAINTKTPALGQAAMASSVPVVIASNQSTLAISAASLPLPAGAATETKQDTANTALANILTQLQANRDIEETIWKDANDVFFVRRMTWNQQTSTATITYTDAAGAVYVPVGTPTMAISNPDIEFLSTTYKANTGGTGYSLDDIIIRTSVMDTGTNPITEVSVFWFNATTKASIAAPTAGHIDPYNAPITIANFDVALSTRLSEATFDSKIGSLTEAAPGTDTASSGLNGRLQRVAQRLTSLIGLFPSSIGQKAKAASLAVTLSSDEDLLALLGSVVETAPGTDIASAGLNGRLQRIAQRLTSLIALQPAALGQGTMAQSFRVVLASDQSAIPVTGTFFQATQPISAASLPLPTGATTEATLAAQSAKLPATLGQKAMSASMAVVLSSDQTWTGATNLGKAEDAAHASGDVGVMLLAVRNDAQTVRGADNDYIPLATDGPGNLRGVGNVAHDAADAGDPLKIGGQARTTNPTAVADADRVNATFDKLGKQIVVGAIRELKGRQATTITSSTAETTIVTAVASTFLDLYGLIIANTSATGVEVSIRDATAGSVIETFYVPANDTRGFMLPVDSAVPQAAVNNNWTAQCGASVASIKITAMYVKNL